MSYVCTLPTDFAAQARAIGQPAAAKDEQRKADRTESTKLRRRNP